MDTKHLINADTFRERTAMGKTEPFEKCFKPPCAICFPVGSDSMSGIAAMSAEELAKVRQHNEDNDVKAPSFIEEADDFLKDYARAAAEVSGATVQAPTVEPDIRYIPKDVPAEDLFCSPEATIKFTDMMENYDVRNPAEIPVLDFTGQIDGGGVKDSMVDVENKPMMSLVPRALILGCAKVMTYGAKKYAPNNWRRGMRWGEPADALLRHFTAWMEGEDTDPESGLSHLAHCSANLAFLMHMETNYEYALMDDRPQTRRFTEDG